MTLRISATLALLTLAGVGLVACETAVKPPRAQNVCYAVVLPEAGSKEPPRFNELARDQPQIEFCAARLEEMRVKFLRMGGSQQDMVGAYNGRYIFIDSRGVFLGGTLTGPRFFSLARTGDGRLAIPGAIQREIDGQPLNEMAVVQQ